MNTTCLDSKNKHYEGEDDGIPQEFICPLTMEMFVDPVMTRAGVAFERNAILDWLVMQGNTTCPITREPLTPSMMIPDVHLRMKISHWHDEQRRNNNNNNNNNNENRKLFSPYEADEERLTKTKPRWQRWNLAHYMSGGTTSDKSRTRK